MRQEFDYAGLEGRLLSSSYAPGTGHPKHEPMLHQLRQIFDTYQAGGHVTFEYNTRLYFGRNSKKGVSAGAPYQEDWGWEMLARRLRAASSPRWKSAGPFVT